VDVEVTRIARSQHGLVSLGQLVAAGLSESAVRKRVATGRLERVHFGAFRIGGSTPTPESRLMAAVLACGPDAVLSHRSAAALWGFIEPSDGPVHVTAGNRRGRAPEGIAAHRNASLGPGDRTVLHNVPCTSVPRLMLDLAAELSIGELKGAVAQAEVKKRLRHPLVREQIRRHRGRRGVAILRVVLDGIHPDTKRTRSELEVLFLAMCTTARIPRPEVNTKLRVAGRRLEVDFLWRQAGLIVEADSRRFHDTYSAFVTDREREQKLQLAGWRVSHCTWEQVERNPRALGQTISALIRLADGPISCP
jgi:very-short-patch-repair endonuclease/predicted transcriptional regulator of viral defense system